MTSTGFRTALHSAAKDWAVALRTCLPIYLIDLKATNRRFWLGPLWVVLPLVLVLLLGVGVGAHRWVGRIPGVAIPYPLYVVTGLAFWQLFAEAAVMPLRRMSGFKVELVRRLMTVEQVLAVGLVDLLLMTVLRLMLVLAIVMAFGFAPSVSLLALPISLMAIIAAGLTFGALVALPGLLVEDIGRAIAFLLTIGVFVSPVFYPVHDLDLLGWNPLTPLIDSARSSVTGQAVNLSATVLLLLAAFVLLPMALLFLRHCKSRFLGALA